MPSGCSETPLYKRDAAPRQVAGRALQVLAQHVEVLRRQPALQVQGARLAAPPRDEPGLVGVQHLELSK